MKDEYQKNDKGFRRSFEDKREKNEKTKKDSGYSRNMDLA